MALKNIEKLIPPGEVHMVGDGFRMQNYIPFEVSMERMNPIIGLDFNPAMHINPSHKPRGVGAHPHRGFETVTIAYKGAVEHNDSFGGGGAISQGDVQWMTAGSGVLHKEYHEKQFSENGGDFELVQLWINLPAKYKMVKPGYQPLSHENLGKYTLPDKGGVVEIIAGEYEKIKGLATTFSPIHMYNIRMTKRGKADFSSPASYNTGLLVIEGGIKVNGKNVPAEQFVLFENKGVDFSIDALENTVVLLLSGEPLNEPIVAHGPFVMNTESEIREAYNDFRIGKFGYLED
jgi:redox-sensitive bicupin YhaK (pirin superfamily)